MAFMAYGINIYFLTGEIKKAKMVKENLPYRSINVSTTK